MNARKVNKIVNNLLTFEMGAPYQNLAQITNVL